MLSIFLAAALATGAEAVSQEQNLAAPRAGLALWMLSSGTRVGPRLEPCSNPGCRKRVGPQPLLPFESLLVQFRREL
jgi:hypothetical protein